MSEREQRNLLVKKDPHKVRPHKPQKLDDHNCLHSKKAELAPRDDYIYQFKNHPINPPHQHYLHIQIHSKLWAKLNQVKPLHLEELPFIMQDGLYFNALPCRPDR